MFRVEIFGVSSGRGGYPVEGGPGAGSSSGLWDVATLAQSEKGDLLFVVDGSYNGGTQTSILARGVTELIDACSKPACIDESDAITARTYASSGASPAGPPCRFRPIRELHVGVNSSNMGRHRRAEECRSSKTPFANDPYRALHVVDHVTVPDGEPDVELQNQLSGCDSDATRHPAFDGEVLARGGLYPSTRQLWLARELGAQAIVASACPVQLTAPLRSDFGFRPALATLLERAGSVLAKDTD